MSITVKHKRILNQVLCIFFVLLFTYAAVGKLRELEIFQIQLKQFPFIAPFAEWISYAVPGVLIFISCLFISQKFRLSAFYSSLVLMIVFTLYIITVLSFADSIPCSCAGIFTTLSWTEHLLFNIGCSILSLLGLALSYDLALYEQEPPPQKIGINE